MEQKEWFSASDLIQYEHLPNTVQGIHFLAKKNEWKTRARLASGGGKEYHISSLPALAKTHIIKQQGKVLVDGKYFDIAKPKSHDELPYSRDALWRKWDIATDAHKAKAKQHVAKLDLVVKLYESGIKLENCFEQVAAEYRVSESNIRNLYYKVKKFNREDWPAVLVRKPRDIEARKAAYASFSEEAWEFFKADWLRPEQPTISACYLRLQDAASEHDWEIPSKKTIERRIKSELDKASVVLAREGQHALMQLYPAQERSVMDLHALEWINGDGYQHNVFVKWPNGETLRPKTWVWQDIYSRKILGYYTDVSENSDMIRLALMRVIEKYGIPKHATIDNTRGAANKWMTGGVKNRYRFKVKDDDPKGILPLLGIQVHWTTVQFGQGHGQAKPVERCFSHGGLGELVDKHPLCAGAYTGPNPMEKPDNYNAENAVSYETFIQALEAGISQFNARPNRQTEVCQGKSSFDDAFAASYEQSVITKAAKEQLRLLMLTAEAVRVQKDGSFRLQAGGKIHNRSNRYHSESLSLHKVPGNKVVVRFDPSKLHESVLCYTLDGVFICEAQCIEAVAFGDTQAAREHDRKRKQFVKARKAAAKTQKQMTIQEAAAMLPEPETPPEPETKIVEIFRPVGSTVQRVEAEEETERNTFQEDFSKGLALAWAEKQNQI